MTDAAAMSQEARDYMQRWAGSVAHVLGQIAGAAFPVECTESAPPEAVPPHESDVLALITSSGGLRGELTLRLAKPVALALAQLLLSEERNPQAEFSQDHRDGVEELLRQVSGHAATAFKSRWGEVQLKVELAAAPSWQPGLSGWMNAASDAPFRVWLEWQMSTGLLGSLKMAEAKAQVLANAQAQLQAQPTAETMPGPEAAGPESPVPGKVNQFMEVGLAVTLRFGGRRMLLGEVLELNTGSVVELDRQVQDPADLLLEGKVIARGEVVVVDGNYGLRVLEVLPHSVSAGERKAG